MNTNVFSHFQEMLKTRQNNESKNNNILDGVLASAQEKSESEPDATSPHTSYFMKLKNELAPWQLAKPYGYVIFCMWEMPEAI